MFNKFESFFTTEMREKRRRFVITAFNHFKDVYNIVQNIEGFELVDNKVTPSIGVEEVAAEVAYRHPTIGRCHYSGDDFCIDWAGKFSSSTRVNFFTSM
jgi:hypothetical protein